MIELRVYAKAFAQAELRPRGIFVFIQKQAERGFVMTSAPRAKVGIVFCALKFRWMLRERVHLGIGVCVLR